MERQATMVVENSSCFRIRRSSAFNDGVLAFLWNKVEDFLVLPKLITPFLEVSTRFLVHIIPDSVLAKAVFLI